MEPILGHEFLVHTHTSNLGSLTTDISLSLLLLELCVILINGFIPVEDSLPATIVVESVSRSICENSVILSIATICDSNSLAILTDQFKDTVSQFRITSQELDKVEKNTSALIDDNGVFAQMIQQLNEVLIEDTKLLESSKILSESSASLQEASQTVKDSSNELNNWITKQNSFNESYTLLMSRLEEIDKIKDINEVFWNDTKKQLEEGVSIISNGSTKLQKDLDEINNSFYERLNSTLQSLDDCIQRMVLNYDESLK